MPRKKSNGPRWFRVQREWEPIFSAMSAYDVGEGFKAALRFFASGEEPEDHLTDVGTIAYRTLRSSVEQANADYEYAVEKGREGGRPTHKAPGVTPPYPPLPTLTQPNPDQPQSTHQIRTDEKRLDSFAEQEDGLFYDSTLCRPGIPDDELPF